jgi:hypothetical protein
MALGSDFRGVRDITPTLEIVGGRQALVEAILGRLITPRGQLPEDLSYGFDLSSCIGSALPVGIIEQRVLEQVTAEEEVEGAICSASLVSDELTVVLRIVDGEGPFSLTLTATELTVEALLEAA